jgi:hypothetical protein
MDLPNTLNFCADLQDWRCRQSVSPTRWYLPTYSDDGTTQNNNIAIFTVLRPQISCIQLRCDISC